MNRLINYIRHIDWLTLGFKVTLGIFVLALTYMLLVLALRFFTNFGGI